MGSNLFMSKCNLSKVIKTLICNKTTYYYMKENDLIVVFGQVWIVGEGLGEDDQMKAPKGTTFIPFSNYLPKKLRNDCFYYTTPAMFAPKYLQNLDSCEVSYIYLNISFLINIILILIGWSYVAEQNWLPRRVMSASRIAGILHALENWKLNECGNYCTFDVEKIWEASLRHGFRPLVNY